MAPAAHATFRRGREDDLDTCTSIWKAAIEDYQSRLNQPPMPDDLAPLRRLLAHLLATDPDRFWVAIGPGLEPGPVRSADGPQSGDGTPIGFACASVRGAIWFLAMLFVHPAHQGMGIGRALMDRAQAGRDVDPGGPAVAGPDDPLDSGIRVWGMCTDAAQPIANGLYARRGMPPRIPIWRLFGEPRRWDALPLLPRSMEAVAFESVAADEPDGHRRLAAIVDGLDDEILGSTHAVDHAWLRREGRVGFLVRDRGDSKALGYAYGSTVGRIGPVAALDPALHPSLIGAAVRGAPALGAVALWVPGTADRATRSLLDAGLRMDGLPGIVCWSTTDHPFDRYLPISLALV